jgi:hypothetical protein
MLFGLQKEKMGWVLDASTSEFHKEKTPPKGSDP